MFSRPIEIKAIITPLLENKKLDFNIIGNRDIEIFADVTILKQIFLNLLSNAIKFTNKGKICIEICDHLDHLEFKIIDTGIGIDDRDNNLIFKEFKRVEQSNINGTPGTGLGLPITKKLVELHGGLINFTSNLGKGSVFIFTISKIDMSI